MTVAPNSYSCLEYKARKQALVKLQKKEFVYETNQTMLLRAAIPRNCYVSLMPLMRSLKGSNVFT